MQFLLALVVITGAVGGTVKTNVKLLSRWAAQTKSASRVHSRTSEVSESEQCAPGPDLELRLDAPQAKPAALLAERPPVVPAALPERSRDHAATFAREVLLRPPNRSASRAQTGTTSANALHAGGIGFCAYDPAAVPVCCPAASAGHLHGLLGATTNAARATFIGR